MTDEYYQRRALACDEHSPMQRLDFCDGYDKGHADMKAEHEAFCEQAQEKTDKDLSYVMAAAEQLRAKLHVAVQALEKIADPRKRDHKEPDKYAEVGCMIHMAEVALKTIEASDHQHPSETMSDSPCTDSADKS